MGFFDYLEEKKKMERRKKTVETAGKVVTGASLGALAGLLFAPKSGKETRKDIANATKDVADSFQYKAYQAGEQVKKTYVDLKEKATEVKENLGENIETAKIKAKEIGDIVKDSKRKQEEETEKEVIEVVAEETIEE